MDISAENTYAGPFKTSGKGRKTIEIYNQSGDFSGTVEVAYAETAGGTRRVQAAYTQDDISEEGGDVLVRSIELPNRPVFYYIGIPSGGLTAGSISVDFT